MHQNQRTNEGAIIFRGPWDKNIPLNLDRVIYICWPWILYFPSDHQELPFTKLDLENSYTIFWLLMVSPPLSRFWPKEACMSVCFFVWYSFHPDVGQELSIKWIIRENRWLEFILLILLLMMMIRYRHFLNGPINTKQKGSKLTKWYFIVWQIRYDDIGFLY